MSQHTLTNSPLHVKVAKKIKKSSYSDLNAIWEAEQNDYMFKTSLDNQRGTEVARRKEKKKRKSKTEDVISGPVLTQLLLNAPYKKRVPSLIEVKS